MLNKHEFYYNYRDSSARICMNKIMVGTFVPTIILYLYLLAVIFYFMRFSNVAAESEVKYTRIMPYSLVSTKDLGRSSQGTT